jgi:hypothetical protein
LIKLLLKAKNKKTNDKFKEQNENFKEQNENFKEQNEILNKENFNLQGKENSNNEDIYDKNYIQDYDGEYKQEEEVMNLNFQDAESAKLIKIIDDEDSNYIIPTNVKIRSTNPNNSFVISRNNVDNFVKGTMDFEINSKKETSPDCYNDYMVNLFKNIYVTDIKIKNIELPKNKIENINSSNNKLKIIINDTEQIFALEDNYYNRYEIKEYLNEAFSAYNFDIHCEIEDDVFIFSSNEIFKMINEETSILSILGFNKRFYVNKNKYIAENSHDIGDNIYYLIIENISEYPLFYINNDTGEIIKLQNIKPITLDHLIIKFYKTHRDLIKNNKEYKYFFVESHLIIFELTL